MGVPYTFGTATTSIPLSQLDANFNTPVTLGNTTVGLGNTVTTVGNLTLTNATISSGTVTVTSISDSGNLTFTGTGNRITGDFSNATIANRVAFQSSTTNGNTSLSIIPNGTATTGVLNTYNNSDPTNASSMQIACTSTDGRLNSLITGTGTYLPLTMYTGGSERLRIDTSGNVGIGTSSPAARFDITQANPTRGILQRIYNSTAGSSQTGAQVQFTQDSRADWVIGQPAATDAFAIWSGRNPSADGTERMRIDSSGNLGVGTSSPNTRIQSTVGSSGSGVVVGLRLQNVGTTAGDGAKILFTAGTSTNGAGISSTGVALDSADLRFETGGSNERMRITSGGQFLVATTSGTMGTSGKTPVQRIANSSNALLGLECTGTSSFNMILFNNGNGEVGTINTSGSATIYSTSSDYRLKENIAPMTGALSVVAQLKPCTYNWKVDGSSGQGFIAHELQEFAPYAVSGEKDGKEMQGVDYGKITPLLTAALQEAIAKIESLEARLAALESK